MKKLVFVVLLLALVLLMVSCKSESKAKDDKLSEDMEQLTEDKKLDDAIDAFEMACESNDNESALKAYENMLRIILDKTIISAKAGNYSDESILTEEQEKRLDKISSDCGCISDEEIQKITEKVENEY